MRKNSFIITSLFVLCTFTIKAQEFNKFNFNGFVDTYHAVRSKSPNDFMSSRSRLRTELNISKGKSYMFASLNAIYNSILEDQTKIELREAFFQYTDKNWDFKVGRQIVIWGVADGMRITDIISPMDYTEFLARDYDDIRIPVNAFRMKYIKPKYNIELIFVPISAFFVLPVDEGNPWSIANLSTIPSRFNMKNTPDKTLKNSEYGGRFSFFLSGIDFSVSALRSWNKMPVFNKNVSETMDTLFVESVHGRINMLGMDFSMPVGKFVLRGEIAEYFGEIQALDLQASDKSKLKRNTTNFLIGIDWYPGNEWTVTTQYSHKLIPGYVDRIESKKNTIFTTLGITKKLLRGTLSLSTFSYIDITNEGFFNRTSTDYALSDQIHLMLGYDWFYGNKGMFGLYQNNSEYWVKAKFSF